MKNIIKKIFNINNEINIIIFINIHISVCSCLKKLEIL